MKQAGEHLYPVERLRYTGHILREKVDERLSLFGAAGEFISANLIWFVTAAALSANIYTGNHWFRQSKIYDAVADKYVASNEVGASALALKRDVADQLTYCRINLTHTPEVKVKIKDSTITIPEKDSMPQLARVNMITMQKIIDSNLSDWTIGSYTQVSERDKTKLAQDREKAKATLQVGVNMLTLAFNTEITYAREMGIAGVGNEQAQSAVRTLEKYMDKGIVEEENAEHSKLSFWKWSTIIGGVITGIVGIGALKSGRDRRYRRRYYG